MGKVGSTSIYFALKSQLGAKVLFAHRLLDQSIEHFNKPYIENGIPIQRFKMAQFIHRHLFNRKQVKIITVVREPMARNISEFFQNFRAYNKGKTIQESTVDEAIKHFIDDFRHDMPVYWIQNELMIQLNLDLDELSIDQEKKSSLIKKENFELLLLRTDLDDLKKEVLVNEFVNTNIKIKRKNTHQEKYYKEFYQQFLDHIIIPSELIEKVYQAEYLTCFYTPSEIQGFKNHWLQKLLK